MNTNLKASQYRAEIYGKIREYFRGQKVLEVETPVLSRGSSVDCHIDVFSTDISGAGKKSEKLFLQTSPEFFMKRMLCDGYPSIFQIGRVFRDGERGRMHNPEFSILEWYRKDFNYRNLMDETAEICFLVLGKSPVESKSYRDVFREQVQVDPVTCSDEELKECIASRGEDSTLHPLREDLLNFIFSRFIQPSLPERKLCFVYNYPMELASLARQDPDDRRLANRFEAFYNGIELCNGYEELADAGEYAARFTAENRKRKTMSKPELPVDKKLLESLKKGLPPCSGAALGLDRLLMLGLGVDDIRDVLVFPVDRC